MVPHLESHSWEPPEMGILLGGRVMWREHCVGSRMESQGQVRSKILIFNGGLFSMEWSLLCYVVVLLGNKERGGEQCEPSLSSLESRNRVCCVHRHSAGPMVEFVKGGLVGKHIWEYSLVCPL